MKAISVLALALSALSTSFAESTAAAPRPTLSARASAYGRALFDSRGFALYSFTREDVRELGGLCLVVCPDGTVVR